MKAEDVDLLVEVVRHCDEIESRVCDFAIDERLFSENGAYRDAILLPLIQIGELVHKVSPEICDEVFGEGVAYQIYGFRNVIVHGYGTIDVRAAWQTVARDIPELRKRLLSIGDVEQRWRALHAASDQANLGSLISAARPYVPRTGRRG